MQVTCNANQNLPTRPTGQCWRSIRRISNPHITQLVLDHPGLICTQSQSNRQSVSPRAFSTSQRKTTSRLTHRNQAYTSASCTRVYVSHNSASRALLHWKTRALHNSRSPARSGLDIWLPPTTTAASTTAKLSHQANYQSHSGIQSTSPSPTCQFK